MAQVNCIYLPGVGPRADPIQMGAKVGSVVHSSSLSGIDFDTKNSTMRPLFPSSTVLSQNMRVKLWPSVFQNSREGKRGHPLTVVRVRLRNHLELVVESNNGILIQMIE